MGAGPLAVMSSYAPSVSIRTLGAFQVLCDGVPVPKTAWQSKKARDLDLRQVDVDVENFLGHSEALSRLIGVGAPNVIGRLVRAEAAHTGGLLEDDPVSQPEDP